MQLELTNGGFTLVSPEDYERCKPYRWYRSVNNYVVCTKLRKSLHRFILHAPAGKEVDHINHDTLDNRRENLRLCTHSQNHGNRRKNTGSRFKGVYHRPGRLDPYAAVIKIRGRQIQIGRYQTAEAAAKAYDDAARVFFGEFACLNLQSTSPAVPVFSRTLGEAFCLQCRKPFTKHDSKQLYCSHSCRNRFWASKRKADNLSVAANGGGGEAASAAREVVLGA